METQTVINAISALTALLSTPKSEELKEKVEKKIGELLMKL